MSFKSMIKNRVRNVIDDYENRLYEDESEYDEEYDEEYDDEYSDEYDG